MRIALVAATLLTASQVSAEDLRPVVHIRIEVDSTNDDWINTGVPVDPGDLVVVFATGEVTVGPFLGSTGPDGKSNGAGQLAARVGPTVVGMLGGRIAFAGAAPSATGKLKLRVQDTAYGDNSGKFVAQVIVVPAPMLPPVESMSPAD